MIQGYKSFSLNKENNYGFKFEEGLTYHIDGDIVFGTKGNGFHFAKNIEDTLRYSIDNKQRDIVIAEVIGYGTIVEGSDEYYGYYDMYSVSDLKIVKFLTREEVLEIAINLSVYRMKRFVSLFKLNEDEINLFYGIYHEVDLAIEYYQLGNKEVYQKEYKLRKVL